MATPPGSLSAALSKADQSTTVLDDRTDQEDIAAFLWMRAHRLHGRPANVVIGTEVLSPGWQSRKKKFPNPPSVMTFLHRFEKDPIAMRSLRVIAQTLCSCTFKPLADDAVVETVGNGLLNGRAWAIDLPKHSLQSRFVSKTDPSVFAPLNPRFSTKVDFTFVASVEGDQRLRGYVPFKGKTGVVAGKSGMTVATGFDIGQNYLEDLQKLKLPQTLLDKIKPFVAPNNFKSMTKAQVAKKVEKLGPVPELTKEEADLCDGAVFSKHLGSTISLWDRKHAPGTPSFRELPGGWQTVLFSREFQGISGPFEPLAHAGKWQLAINALSVEKGYADRVRREVALLKAELPPDLPEKPGVKK